MAEYHLGCPICGFRVENEVILNKCPKCYSPLDFFFDEEYLKNVVFRGPLTFWRYEKILPKVSKIISLGEGGTALHRADRLGEILRLKNFYLKDETRNPTNSFKDRAASLIVSDAYSKGFDSIICATNGNQGAALAAYCAKIDISCHLLVPKALDMGKLAQMIVYDAQIEEAGETIEEAIIKAEKREKETRWYQATAELNPLSVEASKTLSMEVMEQLTVPDWIVVAMGSGATIHAIWKGFIELNRMGLTDKKPRLIGVQAEGCAPIVEAHIKNDLEPMQYVKSATTAVAIKVSSPIYGKIALKDIRNSKGIAVSISDEEMLKSEKEVAKREGIFAEPASAATIACLKPLMDQGIIEKNDIVVSLITSSGLKTDDILKTIHKHKKLTGIGFNLATKEKLLKRIQRSQTYGYDLWKSVGKGMTVGAIYQHLTDLEKRGLITSFAEGKRRYLRLTDKGERVLQALEDLHNLL
ncbi:threonine synthase [Candidatus Bathyarchaeota archaeon]|nr:threonine synthase [Candidatus Bathyarchaeota archaeon]